MTFGFLFLDIALDKNKDSPARMCLFAFLYILAMDIKHSSDLPDVPRMLVYFFGTAVLSVVNSVALATELILKAEKGERTLEELQVIVLPFETFFLAFRLILLMYAYWIKKKETITGQLMLIFPCCQTQPSTSSQQNQVCCDKW
ncbi:hypothetical protein SKAU_G00354070 [Synaphobranchus kaupii]|uniref:Uncharacterized protein n=1 Tax=Synaphobranchus kaupii TaxID=118154 RepID=A0A9Q1EGZ1_SYNKA|nr:hypothetical protein SKAU_G00354070 [Synaphobranchus kaupii]